MTMSSNAMPTEVLPTAFTEGLRLDPAMYINQEVSWLEFNARVLEEAADPGNPLLERVKFLAIFYTNLEEFCMIRISGIREQNLVGVTERSPDGMTPAQELAALRVGTLAAFAEAGEVYRDQICPALREASIPLYDYSALDDAGRAAMDDYFQ